MYSNGYLKQKQTLSNESFFLLSLNSPGANKYKYQNKQYSHI